MRTIVLGAVLGVICGIVSYSHGQTPAATSTTMDGMAMHREHGMSMEHDHGASVAISYDELTRTASMLEAARRATDKYHDLCVAEAEGYHAIGPDVPGMGIHYIATNGSPMFDIERPPILLYERDASVPGGSRLVGVSYLFNAPEGPDGQPVNPPLPKALVHWHRHSNLCVLPDRSVRSHTTESECTALGGNFTAESQWMFHAWIWKDSPTGLFAGTNPNVQ